MSPDEIYRVLKAEKHLFADGELLRQIADRAQFLQLPANTEILREGQYVKVVPIVLEGVIKVFSRFEDKELLLYYIEPGESCIMSFAAALQNHPSRVFAITDAPTNAIVIPTDEAIKLVDQYRDFSSLFFDLYDKRYSELLETIHQLLFYRMDQRIYDYLKHKAAVSGNSVVKITHRQIANELGSAREVVSRVMKKLEREGKVAQHTGGIELL